MGSIIKMVFNRFVENGRVAYIAFGAEEGKLAVIVDVVDQNRALVDGPHTGVKRQVVPFKQLHLTEHVIKIGHSARTGSVKKAWDAAEITQKWEASTWAKKLASRQRRALVTDFERFKLIRPSRLATVSSTSRWARCARLSRRLAAHPSPSESTRSPI